MLERVIMAGFGGQGMMFIGKLLAQAGMEEGFNVTYFPSYGAEVRGGTAHCHVVISSEEISFPSVETADTLIIMNQPSFEKFLPRLKPDGLLLANATMVKAKPDDRIVFIPASQIASEIGNVRVANIVALGAYQKLRSISSTDRILDCLKRALTGKKEAMFDINREALDKGSKAALRPGGSIG